MASVSQPGAGLSLGAGAAGTSKAIRNGGVPAGMPRVAPHRLHAGRHAAGSASAAVAGGRRLRFGIVARVVAGCLIVGGLVLALCVVTLLALGEFTGVMERTTGQQLPLIATASQLAQQGRLLATNTAPLLVADSQFNRRVITQRLKQQAGDLIAQTDALVRRGVALAPLTRLVQMGPALRENIDYLDAKITDRIQAAEAVEAHQRRLEALRTGLSALREGGAGVRSRATAAEAREQWIDLAERAFLLALNSLRATDSEPVQADRDRVNALVLALTETRSRLDGASADQVRPVAALLEQLMSPAGGLWSALLIQHEATTAARLTLSQTSGLPNALVTMQA